MSAAAARFILASASPRRQDLLREAGYAFTVEPANIDEESYPPTLLPSELAEHLAVQKAQAVSPRFPDDVVLAADTVVAFGDLVLGKPRDADDARRMLRLLAGTTHIVITGVAVARVSAGLMLKDRVLSAVRMRGLSPAEIDRYVATNDWAGKAGGYGLQDADLFPADHPRRGDPFVRCLTGSASNIIGLPMERTAALLAEAGVTPAPAPPPPPPPPQGA